MLTMNTSIPCRNHLILVIAFKVFNHDHCDTITATSQRECWSYYVKNWAKLHYPRHIQWLRWPTFIIAWTLNLLISQHCFLCYLNDMNIQVGFFLLLVDNMVTDELFKRVCFLYSCICKEVAKNFNQLLKKNSWWHSGHHCCFYSDTDNVSRVSYREVEWHTLYLVNELFYLYHLIQQLSLHCQQKSYICINTLSFNYSWESNPGACVLNESNRWDSKKQDKIYHIYFLYCIILHWYRFGTNRFILTYQINLLFIFLRTVTWCYCDLRSIFRFGDWDINNIDNTGHIKFTHKEETDRSIHF